MRKTNRFLSWLFAAVAASGMAACSDEDDVKPVSEISLSESYTITRSTVLSIKPEITGFDNASFEWRLIETPDGAKDSVIHNEAELEFIVIPTGEYGLRLLVSDKTGKDTLDTRVTVEPEAEPFSPYLSQVHDYLPGIGQFVNKLPKYDEGDTKENMIAKVNELLAGEDASMITLGGFGGYVVFGFDHTVVNIPGKRDFRVKGNAFGAASNPRPDAPFGGSCEPGVIMVAYDRNKNNEPDADEWYEIAGSAHNPETSEPWYPMAEEAGNNIELIREYKITYFRPEEETEGAIAEYIRWEDNRGNSGYKVKNAFHRQPYFPGWIDGDSYTLEGTLLPQNGIDESGQGNYFVLYAFDFGYADNYPNGHKKSGIDIDWAIDKDGNKVHLPGIDFVRVHCGVNQENGWLGECSTEVAGAEDLHLLEADNNE